MAVNRASAGPQNAVAGKAFPWGAVANTASGLIGGIASLFGQKKRRKQELENFEMQRKHNLELAEYNTKSNVELWNMQNAYNDPSAQMRRLKNAGLNPHLMYGTGTAGTGTNSSAPDSAEAQPANYKVSPKDPSQIVDKFFNQQIMERNIGLADAQIEKTKAEARIQNVNANRIATEEQRRNKEGYYTPKGVNDEWFPSPYMQGQLGKASKQYQDAEFRQQANRIDIEIKNAIKEGKIHENVVKEYQASLAAKDIDPYGSQWYRELSKVLAAKGINLTQLWSRLFD